MCFGLFSAENSVEKSDAAIQANEAAAAKTFNTNYNTAFQNQNALAVQNASRLNYMIANPLGYSPQQLHNATTSINENTATAAKQAIGAAAGFAASHGGADVGSGVTGELVGQLASQAGQSKAVQLANLSNQNQEMKQQNLYSALNGLKEAGSAFGSEAETAAGGGASASNASTTAGTGELAAKAQKMQGIGALAKGIAGLATVGAGGMANLDTTGSSTGGEQALNFLGGM